MPELEAQIPPVKESLTQAQENKAPHQQAHSGPERRRDRRHKGPRQVWIQTTDDRGKLFEEIQIMRDYSRGGFYFVSSLPCYRVGTRLHVIPSFGSLNLEFVAEVVRVEPRPRMTCGVAVKLLRARDSIAPPPRSA